MIYDTLQGNLGEIPPPPDPRKIEWTHGVARTRLHPGLADQLDKLWHDIDLGLFGDAAKTGSFYLDIKSVKDTHPKGEIFKPYADVPPPTWDTE